MAGLQGKEVLLWIHDGEDPGTQIEVPCQGPATYNRGRSLQISTSKNCKLPWEQEDGHSISLTVQREVPAPAGLTRLLAVARSFEAIAVEFKGTSVGAPLYTGNAHVVIENEEYPEEGIATLQITVGFVNDPTEAEVAA